MSLPWVRLDSSIGQNPKIIALAVQGRWRAITVYMVALGWSGQQGTGGFIPSSCLPFIHATRREAGHLVDVGLWHGSDIGDGWIVNDWNDYQPASEYSERAQLKSRKGNCIRWHGHACGCWKASPGDPSGNPTDGRTDGLTTVVNLRDEVALRNAREQTARK